MIPAHAAVERNIKSAMVPEEKKDLTSLLELPAVEGMEEGVTAMPSTEDNNEAITFEPLTETPSAEGGDEALLQQSIAAEKNMESPLESVKELAEHLFIGTPHLEANPAFSLLLSQRNGEPFPDAVIQVIKQTLTQENYGIRLEDLELQWSNGKLFLPRISEYAAIHLAQKVRTLVHDIQLDLADRFSKDSEADSYFLDIEQAKQKSWIEVGKNLKEP